MLETLQLTTIELLSLVKKKRRPSGTDESWRIRKPRLKSRLFGSRRIRGWTRTLIQNNTSDQAISAMTSICATESKSRPPRRGTRRSGLRVLRLFKKVWSGFVSKNRGWKWKSQRARAGLEITTINHEKKREKTSKIKANTTNNLIGQETRTPKIILLATRPKHRTRSYWTRDRDKHRTLSDWTNDANITKLSNWLKAKPSLLGTPKNPRSTNVTTKNTEEQRRLKLPAPPILNFGHVAMGYKYVEISHQLKHTNQPGTRQPIRSENP